LAKINLDDQTLKRLRTRLLLHTTGKRVMLDILRETLLEFPELEMGDATTAFWWLIDNGYIEYDCSKPGGYPKIGI